MKSLVPTARPEALVALADTPVPEPQPGEALVKVEAFSVNRGEIFRLEDPRPDARPGKDIAGLVVQAAADGTGPAAGQRVAGHPEAGGWAEYTLSFFDILGGPQTVTIRSFAYWDSPVPYGRDLAVLLRLVATGRLHPEIGRLAGWEDAAATLTDLYERRILSVGNQVVAEWTSRATARGGAAYHNRNVGIFTVRDGKIAAVREYTDTQHAAHVLFGTP
jgi:ketosteroid isomerase-like protein